MDDAVDIDVEIRRETERAFLVFDGKIELWLPKRYVRNNQDDGTITIPEWLALDQGLI